MNGERKRERVVQIPLHVYTVLYFNAVSFSPSLFIMFFIKTPRFTSKILVRTSLKSDWIRKLPASTPRPFRVGGGLFSCRLIWICTCFVSFVDPLEKCRLHRSQEEGSPVTRVPTEVLNYIYSEIVCSCFVFRPINQWSKRDQWHKWHV